jgi:putative two-component system response regulator
LVVDDNIATLKQIGAVLAPSYSPILAKSGAGALRILETETPNLALLDVHMPDMDGFETLAQIKKLPQGANLPVIFLTGNNDAATEIKALESGAMDFVTKPVNKDILLHRIEMHLKYAAYRSSLEGTVKELEDSIVGSFVQIIDCKDKNSGRHVIRTGKFTRIIGERLLAAGVLGEALTPKILDTIVRAAPFHDVGKIGVSDILLMKKGPLTPEEYDEVKKHTTIGAALIHTIMRRTPVMDYLDYAETIALYHHERWDGAGYPRGLKGAEIPLCARLVAVANAYDSCRTPRSYRPAMGHREAAGVINEGRGTSFDPVIADAFRDVSDECGKTAADPAAGGPG